MPHQSLSIRSAEDPDTGPIAVIVLPSQRIIARSPEELWSRLHELSRSKDRFPTPDEIRREAQRRQAENEKKAAAKAKTLAEASPNDLYQILFPTESNQ